MLNESPPTSLPGLKLWRESPPGFQMNCLRRRYGPQPRSLESTLPSTTPPTPRWQPGVQAPSHTSLHTVHLWSLYCSLSSRGAGLMLYICSPPPPGRILWPGLSRPALLCALWPSKIRLHSIQLKARRLPGYQTSAPWCRNDCVQIQPLRVAPQKPKRLTPT